MNGVALITGGSRGLGATLAAFLAAQDYDLILGARGADELAATAQAASHYGGRVETITGDITDAEVRRCLVAAAAPLGGIDLLVNNASDLGATPLPSLERYPPSELERLFAVNVFAPLALVQEALPLIEKRSGLIVNISSDAAVGGYPGWGGYGASKAALDLLSLTLANELKERGVAVVSVDPGDMRTVMHKAAYPDEDISDRPPPEVTVPFCAWLFGQDRMAVTGRRYRAQADKWELAA